MGIVLGGDRCRMQALASFVDDNSRFRQLGRRPVPLVAGAKKADVVEHPKVFHDVGLLSIRRPGESGLPFI